MVSRQTLGIRTRGRGTTDITAEIARVVVAGSVRTGLYLWEHRRAPYERSVIVTVMREAQ